MNEIQTEIPGVDMVSGAVVRPVGWKRRHKWLVAWRVWCALVYFIYKKWPRNS